MEFPEDLKPKRTEHLSQEQALVKARAWCALQERCSQDTRVKLSFWGVRGEEAEQIIAQLISEGFLNEERFARMFAGGKFRIKKWGRRKIVQELKKKKISEPCIRRGMSVIDDQDYLRTIKALLVKRSREVRETNPLQRKARIINFLVGKGYEMGIVMKAYRELNEGSRD
jgi:regulatory protein